MMHKVLGVTTFEVLVSLLILSPILSILVFTLHLSTRTHIKTKIEKDANYVFLRTSALLSQAVFDIDSHRFHIIPRIHESGFITFTDGTPNPVMSRSNNLAPSRISDGITSIRLDPLATKRVISIQESGSTYRFYACPRFNIRRDNQPNSFLGVHTEGFMELRGKSEHHPGAPACVDLELIPTRSMSVEGPFLDDVKNIRFIVPIEDHYTLYVDKLGQLRYLSHSGNINIENQPVVKGIKKLALNLGRIESTLMILEAETEHISGKSYSFSNLSRLGRLPALNFFLNKP